MGALVFALTFVLAMALSYGITAGLLWLICLCFGWTWWSWQAAIGVWLVLVILIGVWLVLVILKTAFGRSDK